MAIANKWKRPSSIGAKEETEIEVVIAVERQADISQGAQQSNWKRTEQNLDPKSSSLFILSTLGRLKEKHLLLNDRVVLHHAERTVYTGPDHCAVVTRHGHGDQPDGNGTGLRCVGEKTMLAIGRKRILGFLVFVVIAGFAFPIAAYDMTDGSCD
mgnify:CR=1 FL=1